MLTPIKYEERDLLIDIMEEYANVYPAMQGKADEVLKALTSSHMLFAEISDSTGEIVSFAIFMPTEYLPDPSKLVAYECFLYKSEKAKEDIIKFSEDCLKEYGYEVILMSMVSDDKIELKKRMCSIKGYKESARTFVKFLK